MRCYLLQKEGLKLALKCSEHQSEWNGKHILRNPEKPFTITAEEEGEGADDEFVFLSGEGNIKQFLSDNFHFLFEIVVKDIREVGEDA